MTLPSCTGTVSESPSVAIGEAHVVMIGISLLILHLSDRVCRQQVTSGFAYNFDADCVSEFACCLLFFLPASHFETFTDYFAIIPMFLLYKGD